MFVDVTYGNFKTSVICEANCTKCGQRALFVTETKLETLRNRYVQNQARIWVDERKILCTKCGRTFSSKSKRARLRIAMLKLLEK